MKLIIDANVFRDLLEKGSSAATTDLAKNDVSEFGPIRRCIRLSLANKILSVESISQEMTSKSYLKIEDGSGIEPKEDGQVTILAKDLINWVAKQKSSKMSISFVKEELQEEENTDKFQLKIIGKLKLMAKDDANTGNKWAVDVFKEDLMPEYQIDTSKKMIFSISSKKLHNILQGSLFAVGSENNGITDRFSFQKNQNSFYTAATDSRCCVLTNLTEDVKNLELNLDQILVNAKNLIFLIKKFGENIVNVYLSDTNDKLFIVNESLECSISLGDPNKFKAFPLVANYFSKTQYPVSFSFNKITFLERMENIKVVNNIAAIFVVQADKVFIHGISEVGKQPTVATMPITLNGTPSIDRYVWGVQHLINGAKSCAGDIVKISISHDNNSFKMNGIDDDSFSVYGMRINNEKYSKVELK